MKLPGREHSELGCSIIDQKTLISETARIVYDCIALTSNQPGQLTSSSSLMLFSSLCVA